MNLQFTDKAIQDCHLGHVLTSLATLRLTLKVQVLNCRVSTQNRNCGSEHAKPQYSVVRYSGSGCWNFDEPSELGGLATRLAGARPLRTER